jgi:hypothetical protein
MSDKISEILPKQVNPAFLVLAPCGKIPFSKTTIVDLGCFSLKERAQLNPTIPLPITA